jgi:uncharacterized protein (TIGR00290 family)
MPAMKRRALVSWSSGKDCAWALHELRVAGDVEIVGLLTTSNEAFDRVSMHGVPMALVDAQARAAGLPVWRVPLPWPCTNDDYEVRMRAVVERARAETIDCIAFGDLFLADVRAYRERQLAGTGLQPLFPLWGRATASLVHEMLAAGLRATLACVDPKQLDPRFVGRPLDESLLAELPAAVDPCGENGEFHAFCHAGPMFAHAIAFTVAGTVEHDGFWYADLRAG